MLLTERNEPAPRAEMTEMSKLFLLVTLSLANGFEKNGEHYACFNAHVSRCLGNPKSMISMSAASQSRLGVFTLRLEGGFDVWADDDNNDEEATLQKSRTAKDVRKAAR
jgi:hypothetical protein